MLEVKYVCERDARSFGGHAGGPNCFKNHQVKADPHIPYHAPRHPDGNKGILSLESGLKLASPTQK